MADKKSFVTPKRSEEGKDLRKWVRCGETIKAPLVSVLCCVELEGVEPSSKQGTRKLSTRLSFDWSSYRSLAEGGLTTTPAYKILRIGIGVGSAISV